MSAISQNIQGLKVLVAGSILQLFLGIIYVWSVFVSPVSAIYEWKLESAKLTSSFMLCFFVIGIIFGGKLMQKTGAPKVVLLGGLLLAAGMFTTAFLPASYAQLMYLTYGIIGGFGVGAGYNAALTAAQKWFPQHRGFATGISAGSFGFSTVIFAPLITKLIGATIDPVTHNIIGFEGIEIFGFSTVRSTFIILAASFLIVILVLFRFIKLPDESAAAGASSPTLAALLAKKQYAMSETIKTKEFYLIAFSLMFGTATYFVLNPSFKTFAIDRGLSASIGVLVVMITGVANAMGRLLTPLLSDKIGREKAVLTIISITIIGALLMIFVQGPTFVVTIALIAFCYGGLPGVYPVLTADYFGIKNVGANYGAVMMGFALSALCFPMIIALIGSVTIKFIVLAAMAACGVLLLVLLMKVGRKE